jgi:hypothetical protein
MKMEEDGQGYFKVLPNIRTKTEEDHVKRLVIRYETRYSNHTLNEYNSASLQ